MNGDSAPAAAAPRLSDGKLLALVALVNLAATLLTVGVTLRRFPNSADEYACLISAELFSEFWLSAPSPPERDFFDVYHVVNDGRFYGKYPPGWPAFLAVGVRAGLPWLINPLFGVLTLWVLYRTAREHLSAEVARGALALALFNPFLVLNSASYFSHPSCLFFISLALMWGLRLLREPDRARHGLLLGGAAGIAFLIRPYTALCALAPVLIGVGLTTLQATTFRRWLLAGARVAIPLVACALLGMAYNRAQTGDPLVQPFSRYEPGDRPGQTPVSHDYAWGLKHNVLERLVKFAVWVPLAPLFLALSLQDCRSPEKRALLGCFAGLSGGYFFYLFNPGNEYGPRYWYEAMVPVLILVSGAISRLGPLRKVVLPLLVVCNVAVLAVQSRSVAEEVTERSRLYEVVRENGISNAVVFLSTGSGTMPPKDLTRNGTRFDGPVLYVHDLGPRNAELKKKFPGRRFFTYTYDGASRTGRLVPAGP